MFNKEKYLYVVNYPTFEEKLCMLEMRRVFKKEPIKKVLFSDYYLNPSYSPFIKSTLEIIYAEDSLDKIVENIKKDKVSFNDFKVEYIRLEDWNVPYEERLHSVYECGFNIIGEPDIHNPKISIGITKVLDTWLFGIYIKNDYKWHIHDNKPCSYSNSLSTRVAKALTNIAVEQNREKKIVDPCCGVGTVVIEGLDSGLDIEGFEINPPIAKRGKRNLEFFNLQEKIEKGDMHKIDKKYDVSIIDIPYGLFTPTTKEEQKEIINTARRISKEMVLVAFEDMDEMIEDAKFTIVDRCSVNKGRFVRYVLVCK